MNPKGVTNQQRALCLKETLICQQAKITKYYKVWQEAGETAQWLKAQAGFAGEPDLVPSTRMVALSTVCNSSVT